jgi:hypothetical protein
VLDDLPLADLGVMTIDNVDSQRRYSSFVCCGSRFYLRRIVRCFSKTISRSLSESIVSPLRDPVRRPPLRSLLRSGGLSR